MTDVKKTESLYSRTLIENFSALNNPIITPGYRSDQPRLTWFEVNSVRSQLGPKSTWFKVNLELGSQSNRSEVNSVQVSSFPLQFVFEFFFIFF